MPLTLDDGPEGIERVLVVTAHPDDVDFGAGGTVATLTGAGVNVVYCIVTDGDAGGSDRTVSRADLSALRREEQRAAAAEVGVQKLTFLGYSDGRLTPSFDLRRDISRVIRQFRPQRIITHSPERSWTRLGASHPDHLATGEATTCAVYPDARNPFAFPELLDEGLEPHIVPQLWLMATERADRAVDVTDAFPAKLAGLFSHRSQVGDGEGFEELLRSWLSGNAQSAGLPDGRLAEAFQVVQIG